MKSISWASVTSVVLALAFFAVSGCGGQSESSGTGDGEAGLGQESVEGEGEHAEVDEHGEEGEESGEYIGRGESWDETRRGMRLTLSFDEARDAFVGTVEKSAEVELPAEGQSFERWTAHPERSACGA